MISIAKNLKAWFNYLMKSILTSVKKKALSKYLDNDVETRSTDINILLNRVKVNQKNETKKKLYFSVAASAGLFLFGLVIF